MPHKCVKESKNKSESLFVSLCTLLLSALHRRLQRQSQITSWPPPPWTSSWWSPPSWPGVAPLCACGPLSSWFGEPPPGHCATEQEFIQHAHITEHPASSSRPTQMKVIFFNMFLWHFLWQNCKSKYFFIQVDVNRERAKKAVCKKKKKKTHLWGRKYAGWDTSSLQNGKRGRGCSVLMVPTHSWEANF